MLTLPPLNGGCVAPTPPSANDQPAQSSISADDILWRCGQAYATASSLRVRGLMRDYRGGGRRVANMAWDIARPDRCRLQIDMDVSLVVGQRWWVYTATEQQYRSRPQFTRTPMETAGYLMTNGVNFLTPALFNRGDRVFGLNRNGVYPGWRLESVGWIGEWPCYVISRPESGQQGGLLRIWVDQDSFMLRGWTLGGSDEENPVIGCSYYEVTTNEPVPLERFTLRPPQPIELALPKPGSPGVERPNRE